MRIRPFRVEDALVVTSMMWAEGIPPEDVYVKDGLSFVLDDGGSVVGFFGFNNQSGRPKLAHFCVARKSRSLGTALELARAVRSKCREIALDAFYIDVKHPYLEKFIQWFFRPKSRYVSNGYSYFFVEVK